MQRRGHKARLLGAALAVVLALVVPGCGGGGSGTAEAATDGAAALPSLFGGPDEGKTDGPAYTGTDPLRCS